MIGSYLQYAIITYLVGPGLWYLAVPLSILAVFLLGLVLQRGMLAPVRDSYRSGKSLQWHRVYNLPGFVYFDHSIHVHKGVGCSSCHGRVDEMPLMYQVPSLFMEWCLNCHRQPEKHLRPQADIFNMKWQPPDNQDQVGRQLARRYEIRDTRYLTTCSVCHR